MRIYIDSYVIAAGTNGIIGANVKYQYPFNGEATSIGLTSNTAWFDDYFKPSPTSIVYYGVYYGAMHSTPIYIKNKVSCELKFETTEWSGFFSFDGSDGLCCNV